MSKKALPIVCTGGASPSYGRQDEKLQKDFYWFAVWTRSRQEKTVAALLESLKVIHFLPLRPEMRQWSDRRQKVTFPLFPGYLFVRMNSQGDSRLRLLQTPGIAGIVGDRTGPKPIPDQQIDDIRRVLSSDTECSLSPALSKGERVRIVRGALAGIEGTLVRMNARSMLVISVEPINRALTVNISIADIEAVKEGAA